MPDASTADVDRAVAAARKAFDEGPWPHMSPVERAEAIGRLSAALQARAQDIADTISSENGSPKQWSIMGQVFSSTMVLDSYVALATQYQWVDTRTGMMGGPVRVRQAPVGVVAAITPWNVPLFIAALKLGPGLLAGVHVRAEAVARDAARQLPARRGDHRGRLPRGVINIIPAGRETGEYLVKHPSIDKVSFTGSTAAGMRIGELCGGQLKRCTLELGGKSAAIVLDDVEPRRRDARRARAERRDEQRPGVRRAEPHPRVAQALRRSGRRARHRVGALKVGDPLDDATQIGPLVAERQRTRVEGYIDAGKAAGARLVDRWRPSDGSADAAGTSSPPCSPTSTTP